MKKYMYIALSSKGGTGKTLTSLSTILTLRDIMENRNDLMLAEVDTVKKLSIILGEGDVDISLKVDANLLKQLSDPLSAEKYFARLSALFESNVSLVDLGANLAEPFLNWFCSDEVVELIKDEGITPVFLAVSSPDFTALTSANDALINAYETFKDNAFYVFVENNSTGSGFNIFEPNDTYQTIKSNLENLGGVTLSIPHAPATTLINYGTQKSLSLYETYTIAELLAQTISQKGDYTSHEGLNEMAERLGLNAMETRAEKRITLKTEIKVLANWIREVRENILNSVPMPIQEINKTESSDE